MFLLEGLKLQCSLIAEKGLLIFVKALPKAPHILALAAHISETRWAYFLFWNVISMPEWNFLHSFKKLSVEQIQSHLK